MTETAVWLPHTDQKQSGMPSMFDLSVELIIKIYMSSYYLASQLFFFFYQEDLLKHMVPTNTKVFLHGKSRS